MRSDHRTVFNAEKAAEAAPAARDAGYAQALLARVQAPGDRFHPGHEGGFDTAAIGEAAEVLDRVPGGRFAGLTTFPALLYDRAAGGVRPTPNLRTMHRAAERLARLGREGLAIDAPGTTSARALAALADGSATRVARPDRHHPAPRGGCLARAPCST